jgi:hypothetical protein
MWEADQRGSGPIAACPSIGRDPALVALLDAHAAVVTAAPGPGAGDGGAGQATLAPIAITKWDTQSTMRSIETGSRLTQY